MIIDQKIFIYAQQQANIKEYMQKKIIGVIIKEDSFHIIIRRIKWETYSNNNLVALKDFQISAGFQGWIVLDLVLNLKLKKVKNILPNFHFSFT